MKELELILATIAQLGEAGKEAFIWWLVFDKALYVFSWLMTIWIIAAVITRIVKTVYASDADTRALLEIRRTLGLPGTYNGPLDSRERDAIIKWVKEAVTKQP